MCTIPQIVFDLSHTTKIYNVTTKLVLCCQLDSLAKKTAVLSYPSSLLIPYDESRVNSRQVEMAITRAEDTAITHVLNVRLYTAERKQIDLSERLEAQPPLLFYSTAPVLRFDKVTPFCLIQFNNPPHLHHTPNYILEIEVKSGSTSLTRAIEIFFRSRSFCNALAIEPPQPGELPKLHVLTLSPSYGYTDDLNSFICIPIDLGKNFDSSDIYLAWNNLQLDFEVSKYGILFARPPGEPGEIATVQLFYRDSVISTQAIYTFIKKNLDLKYERLLEKYEELLQTVKSEPNKSEILTKMVEEEDSEEDTVLQVVFDQVIVRNNAKPL